MHSFGARLMRTGTTDTEVPRNPSVHMLTLTLRGRERAVEARLSMTTPGLLAVGAMVSSILLGVTAIVAASTRKLPEGTRPRDL
jgi:hypothetical protein